MSTPAGRMATLTEFVNAGDECESLAADHQGELDTVSADVIGQITLCERHRSQFARIRDGLSISPEVAR